jgi:hypothetical protein
VDHLELVDLLDQADLQVLMDHLIKGIWPRCNDHLDQADHQDRWTYRLMDHLTGADLTGANGSSDQADLPVPSSDCGLPVRQWNIRVFWIDRLLDQAAHGAGAAGNRYIRIKVVHQVLMDLLDQGSIWINRC